MNCKSQRPASSFGQLKSEASAAAASLRQETLRRLCMMWEPDQQILCVKTVVGILSTVEPLIQEYKKTLIWRIKDMNCKSQRPASSFEQLKSEASATAASPPTGGRHLRRRCRVRQPGLTNRVCEIGCWTTFSKVESLIHEYKKTTFWIKHMSRKSQRPASSFDQLKSENSATAASPPTDGRHSQKSDNWCSRRWNLAENPFPD